METINDGKRSPSDLDFDVRDTCDVRLEEKQHPRRILDNHDGTIGSRAGRNRCYREKNS